MLVLKIIHVFELVPVLVLSLRLLFFFVCLFLGMFLAAQFFPSCWVCRVFIWLVLLLFFFFFPSRFPEIFLARHLVGKRNKRQLMQLQTNPQHYCGMNIWRLNIVREIPPCGVLHFTTSLGSNTMKGEVFILHAANSVHVTNLILKIKSRKGSNPVLSL